VQPQMVVRELLQIRAHADSRAEGRESAEADPRQREHP
jgi:hypothetical protein